ncbi:LPS-assembly protein LptD [Coraliomargarita parva]|uniref:LPS-assembly protein LptD n=1 Tax=Coraliomargarita parva TaxID=3014050 RepID=UPI0022B4E283|nr:LPS assembly protein LptD [Coraliomargarita parva]
MPQKARNYILISLIGSQLSLSAALPELSSIEPIEFDEAAQRLVARGDARLDFEDTRVRADRISYYQDFALADALGNVAINRDGYRVIADRLSFDAEESILSMDVIRTGEWPLYVSGVTAGGTLDNSSVQGATLYYGNPGSYTLSVASDAVHYVREEEQAYLEMEGATFRVGKIPFFYLPSYTHYISESPYFLDLSAGYDNELGAYLQTTTLLPVTPWLRLGANLDYYTKRGVLAGPTAQYVYNSERQSITGSFGSGYISDHGGRGEDVFGDPINEDRGFIQWRHKQQVGERFNLTASADYWSDSEAIRDFRDDYYNDNRQPDSFVEAVYSGDNYYLSAFGRFQPNEFQLINERLPEVRLDLLPVPIFETGAYHRGAVSYARLRQDLERFIPTIHDETEYDRFDLSYRIERPIAFSDWLTLTPLAGARITHYTNQEIDPANPYYDPELEDDFTRDLYEVGFDLESRFHATYPTYNKTWKIDGLRHILRPVLRYRYYSDSDADGKVAVIEGTPFDLERPVLDLSDLRNADVLTETHLARLGVENLFQTQAQGYGSRTLAALNFYQDILFEKGVRYDGDDQNTFEATWVELVLSPAPWLKFDLAARFKTESLTLEELRTRTRLISGEIWEIGLSSDLLNKHIDQYRLDYIYRVNERLKFLADARYDADTGKFTEFGVGVQSNLGNAWVIIYALTFRNDAQRESDVEFSIRLKMVGIQ